MSYPVLFGAVWQIATARAHRTLRSLSQAASGTCQKTTEAFGKCVKGISLDRCLDCAALATGILFTYITKETPLVAAGMAAITLFYSGYAFSPRFRDSAKNRLHVFAFGVDYHAPFIVDHAPAFIQRIVRPTTAPAA